MFHTPTSKVAAGAKLLDQFSPGWEKIIDLDELDLRKGDLCMLGQLFGTYDVGVGVLRIKDPVRLGFYVGSDSFDQSDRRTIKRYEKLNQCWSKLISKRRQKAAA